MEITNINWSVFLQCIGVSGVVVFFMLRRHVFGIFDPWIMLILDQTIVLGGLAYYFWTGQMQAKHFTYVLACFIFFVGGLQVFYKNNFKPLQVKTVFSLFRLRLGGMQVFYPKNCISFDSRVRRTPAGLRLAILMLLFLYIVDNLVIFSLLGIPTLGVRGLTMYASLGRGYGVLSYLNTGLGFLLSILSMKAWLMYKQRLGLVSLFVMALFIVLISGGKSVFLGLFFLFGLSAYCLGINYKISVKVPKLIWLMLAILAVMIMYSFVSVVKSGYAGTVPLAFIRRLVNGAAGPYFYFVRGSYLGYSGLNLLSYHFSQITPYFGYRDIEAINLGVNLTLYSDLRQGTPGFGPTPLMYTIGHIAWGEWGVLYCFFIGVIMSFVRYRIKAGFVVWIALNSVVGSLPYDGTLCVLYSFYMLLLSPIIIVAYLITTKNSSASHNGLRYERLAE